MKAKNYLKAWGKKQSIDAYLMAFSDQLLQSPI